MSHDARAVANYILDKAKDAGQLLTPMQLLKLVYIAHGWNLAISDAPLIKEDVQAWKFGPVIPSLYHEFKKFGAGNITGFAEEFDFDTLEFKKAVENFSEEETQLMDRVFQVYSRYDGLHLSNLTHATDTPWEKTWQENAVALKIPNQLIKEHFVELAQENERRKAS